MPLHRMLVMLFLSLCTSVICNHAHAQHPGFFNKGDDDSDFTSLYDPFCDLDTCWFEPIQCECPDRPLNSGWFFGYSRMNLRVSRPRVVTNPTFGPVPGINPTLRSIYQETGDPSDYAGDWAWGNRFDFGWVSEQGSGLWFVARKLDSPSERVLYDNIDLNLDEGLRLDNEPWGPTSATINGLRMWGFEMNKIWRLANTANGTVMEPFVGPRYVKLRDHADRTDIYTDISEQLNFPLLQGPNFDDLRYVHFNYQVADRVTDNNLFGGQFGMRSRWRRGRWQITSDVRGLAFWNHQVRETRTDNEIQREPFVANYNGDGELTGFGQIAGTAVVQDFQQITTHDTNNTFVYGGELHLEAAFELTQGFAITLGGEIIAFADGIGRGIEGVDDSLVMTGFSLGFTLNR